MVPDASVPPASQLTVEAVTNFAVQIRHGKITGSYNVSVETVKVLRKLIAHGKWSTPDELLLLLRNEGRKMCWSDSCRFVIPNMIRRVMRLIRDELANQSSENLQHEAASASGRSLVFTGGSTTSKSAAASIKGTATASAKGLRVAFIEIINEYLVELETAREFAALHAAEHLEADDSVMTIGQSDTLREVLKLASKKKKMRFDKMNVYVVFTCGLEDKAEKFASFLRTDCPGLNAIVIPMSAVYTTMSCISKVLLGACAIFPDGSFQAVCGAHNVTLAAQRFRIPVLVCAVFYKLTPTLYLDESSWNRLGSPQDVLKFSEGAIVTQVHIRNPLFDRVPADLVTLYITNMISGNAPSYVYRLVNELYSTEDDDFCTQ